LADKHFAAVSMYVSFHPLILKFQTNYQALGSLNCQTTNGFGARYAHSRRFAIKISRPKHTSATAAAEDQFDPVNGLVAVTSVAPVMAAVLPVTAVLAADSGPVPIAPGEA